jgi:hypothetical protein
LRRREAVLLLQEIIECCQDAALVNFVVLRRVANRDDAEDFELHLKVRISDFVRDMITSIADKHQLLTLYTENYMVIYSPGTPPLQLKV